MLVRTGDRRSCDRHRCFGLLGSDEGAGDCSLRRMDELVVPDPSGLPFTLNRREPFFECCGRHCVSVEEFGSVGGASIKFLLMLGPQISNVGAVLALLIGRRD